MVNQQKVNFNQIELFGHQNIPEESKSDIWLARQNEANLKESI